MGGMTDKIKGAFNEAVGAVKENLGQASDDPELEVDGAVQQAKGKAQSVVGTVKEKVGEAYDATVEKAGELAEDAKEAIHRATR